MGDRDWRDANEPSYLWRIASERATWRQMRLFCAACVQRVLCPELPEEVGQLVELVEHSSDAKLDYFVGGELRLRVIEQRQSLTSEALRHAALAAINAASVGLGSGIMVNYCFHCFHEAAASCQDPDAEYSAQAHLLRDIFGNPFRPVIFSSDWRTDTVVTLACQMYDSREFSAMPIFADALQDAGCDNDDILSHCRDATQVHVRGCWVYDLVLGKT